jgi:cob(I)alamin adenosyltransferase
MTKLFTGRGDDGTTGLLGDKRVQKSDIRLEAIGTLDELSANLGVAKGHVSDKFVKSVLEEIQRDLYAMMTDIAAVQVKSDKFKPFSGQRVEVIEKWIEVWEIEIELPHEFILPGETVPSAVFSVCRTVTRRAERKLVELFGSIKNGNEEVLRYINRLSSLLYTLEIKYSKKGRKQKLKFAKV